MNARALPLSTVAADLVSLTKPRLSSLVLCTAAGGLWMAPGKLAPAQWILALGAIAGTVGSANALNCYLERDSDQRMARTRNRPLPAGRMEPAVALWFGLSLGVVSLAILALGTNLLTAALGLLALVSYVLCYTPLKARSETAMLVGGVPGALPPLMGWTAATGKISLPGVVLFGILFFWQMPHFLAIALFRKEEYRQAGLHSVPLRSGDSMSRAQIVAYLLVLLPIAYLPFPLHLAGKLYLVVSSVLGAVFLGLGVYGAVLRLGRPWARQLFFFSLVYLTGLFAVMMIDSGAPL